MAEVVDMAAFGVGGDNRFGDFVQPFLQAQIGCHDRFLSMVVEMDASGGDHRADVNVA
jgi:hypothetical protein